MEGPTLGRGKDIGSSCLLLSNGDQYSHLGPLSINLQHHLKGRNDHAHDGKFLDSFFVPPQTSGMVVSTSSSSSDSFGESVKTFMTEIAKDQFDTKLKKGLYKRITGNSTSRTTRIPVLDQCELPKIYTGLVQKVAELYHKHVDANYQETNIRSIHHYMAKMAGFGKLKCSSKK